MLQRQLVECKVDKEHISSYLIKQSIIYIFSKSFVATYNNIYKNLITVDDNDK